VGPVIAGIVLGEVEDVSRFPGRDHFAACNGTGEIGGVAFSLDGRKLATASHDCEVWAWN
jgi:hypothetical protein